MRCPMMFFDIAASKLEMRQKSTFQNGVARSPFRNNLCGRSRGFWKLLELIYELFT